MQILSSKSLACAPWRPPTSWQMGINVSPCGRVWLSHPGYGRGTPHSAVSWVEGGGATVTRVRARDGPDIEKDVETMREQDHVRALPRVQHEVGDLLAAREASHPGEHVTYV